MKSFAPWARERPRSSTLARDPDLDRLVAIKLIRFGEDNAAMSRRLRKLFQTEDSIGRRLDHPNIVRIYDAVVEPEQAYLAMEFVDGAALDKFCAINRLLPMHRVIGIIFKCCLALDHAFRQGSCIATSSRPIS
jgi:serine/threonine protein kinase